ncbi:MAG: hypothetical protein ACKV22_23070 [Bryobacteraceae bacterium]
MIRRSSLAILILSLGLTGQLAGARGEAIEISSPMRPPEWALLERALLKENARLVEVFVDKYVNPSNGFLEVVEHWGGADGPDDAMENFYNWPLLYVLGAPRSTLERFQFVWNGHIRQYSALGMYHREFITSFDWEHNGEAYEPFLLLPLADPDDRLTRQRTVRFANLYTGRDPSAGNYDGEHKVIRSILNGSRGPKLQATPEDWGGTTGQKYFRESGDWTQVKGDVPINMLATSLATNAYILTGDKHYRDWAIEYVDAWRDRAAANGGNIPSIVGLNGKVGEGWGGKWYGGLMGWNWVFGGWGILGRGPRIGFSNAMLLTGDSRYLDTLRVQGKNLLHNRIRTAQGLRFPDKYGDQGWHSPSGGSYFEALFSDIYLTALDRTDLERLRESASPPPSERRGHPVWNFEYESGRFEGGNEVAWIDFLQGNDPGYPVRALQDAFARIRWIIAGIRSDHSTPDTRNADGPHQIRLSPEAPLGVIGAVTGALTNLTLGARQPHWSGGLLYAELRYFDPERRRPGLPQDVAALVTSITPEAVTLMLVNLDQTQSRDLIVQTGAYGEHQTRRVAAAGGARNIDHHFFRIRLKAGSGGEIRIERAKYANQPSFAFPWSR